VVPFPSNAGAAGGGSKGSEELLELLLMLALTGPKRSLVGPSGGLSSEGFPLAPRKGWPGMGAEAWWVEM